MNRYNLIQFYFVPDQEAGGRYHADYMDRDKIRRMIEDIVVSYKDYEQIKPVISYCRLRNININGFI